jgi:hypothetical protein
MIHSESANQPEEPPARSQAAGAAGLGGPPLAPDDPDSRDQGRARVERVASLVTIVLSIGLFAAAWIWERPSPGADVKGERLATGVYILRSTATTTCMDGPGWTQPLWVSQDETLNDAPCSSASSQRWILHALRDGTYTIESQAAWKCLDIPGFRTDDGAPLQQYPCNEGTNQAWRKVDAPGGAVSFASVANGKCISVDPAPRGRLHQASCDGGPTQLWKVERAM